MRHLFINGRYLSQRTTGVQRYADQVVQALDEELADERSPWARLPATLLVPPNAVTPALHRIEARTVGYLAGQAWEQLELAAYARGGLLLSLGNTAPLLAKRLAVTIHDASVFAMPETYSRAFGSWYRFLLPYLGRRAGRVMTVSEFSRGELQRYAGIASCKLRVAHLGSEHILNVPADFGVFERLALRRDRFILAVSSASPHKNLGALAEAVALLRDVDFDVVVAGGANDAIFQQLAIDGPLLRAGYVTDGELRALYERAACFVFPSLYEGFGLPPLEAMRCGCPVIAARAASLPEVCGDAAAYCDPRDPGDIARVLREVMLDPTRRAQMGSLGVRQASRFTWRRTAQRLLVNMEDLLRT